MPLIDIFTRSSISDILWLKVSVIIVKRVASEDEEWRAGGSLKVELAMGRPKETRAAGPLGCLGTAGGVGVGALGTVGAGVTTAGAAGGVSTKREAAVLISAGSIIFDGRPPLLG